MGSQLQLPSPMQLQHQQQQHSQLQQSHMQAPLITLDAMSAYHFEQDAGDGAEEQQKQQQQQQHRQQQQQQQQNRSRQSSIASRRYLDVTPLMLTPNTPALLTPALLSPASALLSPGSALLSPDAASNGAPSAAAAASRISYLSPHQLPNGDILLTPRRRFFQDGAGIGAGVNVAPEIDDEAKSFIEQTIAAVAAEEARIERD